MTKRILQPLALCDKCRAKYPRMAEHPQDTDMFAKYDCEVCEGETDPGLWNYGNEIQIADAKFFNRDK